MGDEVRFSKALFLHNYGITDIIAFFFFLSSDQNGMPLLVFVDVWGLPSNHLAAIWAIFCLMRVKGLSAVGSYLINPLPYLLNNN